jgi:hypothetical protein
LLGFFGQRHGCAITPIASGSGVPSPEGYAATVARKEGLSTSMPGGRSNSVKENTVWRLEVEPK